MAARSQLGRRFTGATAAALLLTGALVSVGTGPAAADTAPLDPSVPVTVSADALPTVQINGVAWKQQIVGNTVYVGGRFTSARPPGAAAGTSESPRSNLLAYNLTTGALVTGFAPTFNGQILGMAASPDSSRLYVVGEFTQVNGQNRYRVAAFNTATGALDESFRPAVDFRARAVVATASTVYVGGAFSASGSQSRTRLAAFAASNGALQSWAPVADGGQVMGLAISPDGSKVVASGQFTSLAGVEARGMGAVDAATGAPMPWAVNKVIQNYGEKAAIYSLSSDGTNVYGTGYDYFGPSDFENVFAARWADGELVWVNGCLGDTYDAVPVGGVVYAAGHPHNCSQVGGHPQTEPWTFQRAQAMTVQPRGVNLAGSFRGRPAPELLHWLPTLEAGTFTGQSQAAWTVTGNSQYVLLGGEFPRVNGTRQQGLTRFAVKEIAPNVQGPQATDEMTPNLVSLAPGTVRVAWKTAWDRDNENLTYEVLRGSTVIGTVTSDSSWWNRPTMAFTDQDAGAGTTQSYRVRVSDAFANRISSTSASIAVPAGDATPSAYGARVTADGATHWWRLGEASGTTSYDWVGGDDLSVDASATRGVPGALPEPNTATGFSGSANVPATTTNRQPGPDTFSAEAWFSTTTRSGGKIVGFGNSSTGPSSAYDRHVYMDDAGRLVFGVYPGTERRVTSPAAYNDGQWHHVVATLGAGGMQLVVDGRRVAGRTDTTSGQAYSGYWRIGGDNTWGSSSSRFAGSIDEIAVYPTALTVQQAADHYAASGRTAVSGVRPADAYGRAVYDASPDSYWRLNEAAGATSVADVTANAAGGVPSGGPTFGVPGVVSTTAVRLDGADDSIAASQAVSNPTVYSQELWFNTTTTRGGKLIGFGRAQSGNSSSYDRHVWMTDAGRLVFGTWTGQTNTIETPASYNDGAWHHMVSSQGPDGMKLYVDGQLTGINPQTGAEDYPGYWRIGGDVTWFGASSNYFAGTLDEVAVYPVVLSAAQVTDHWTKGGGGQPPNAAPTARFTAATSGLQAAVDGSGSTDPDGSIASWAWSFGDGATGAGATTSHTYTAAGTYTVSLTVTDDRGGSHTATQEVSVAPVPNAAPTASFTSSTTDLTVSVDSTASSDTDGTVVARAWDFGDGSTSDGVTATRTYAAAGSYTVTLTVTDDDGAVDTETAVVTVEAPPAGPQVYASDAFGRTATGGFGTADVGGSWTPVASPSSFSVAGGVGRITLPAAGARRSIHLGGVQQSAVDVSGVLSLDKAQTGSGTFVSLVGRRVGTAEYRARVRVTPTGSPTLSVTRAAGSTETALQSVVLPGTLGAGERFAVRIQVSGTSPTTVRAKAWKVGATEPGSWQLSTTDGTAALQAAGSVGVDGYLSASSTNAPITLTVDDLRVTSLDATPPPPNAPPTAQFDASVAGAVVSVDGSASSDADGTVTAHAWSFGDGTSGSGARTSHTYATGGTFTVTLTVTDDGGAQSSTTRSVTVTPPPAGGDAARDTFSRTVTSGWGDADLGGAWSLTGGTTSFSVTGGSGRVTAPTVGATRTAVLPGAQLADSDVTAAVSLDRAPTGGGTYVSVIGRRAGTAGDYRARLRYLSTGAVTLQLMRVAGGTETLLTQTNVAGITSSPGGVLRVRVQVTGSGTSTLRARVWADGTAEPAAWALTATDATAALQSAGSPGVSVYVSGSATAVPVVSFDDLVARSATAG